MQYRKWSARHHHSSQQHQQHHRHSSNSLHRYFQRAASPEASNGTARTRSSWDPETESIRSAVRRTSPRTVPSIIRSRWPSRSRRDRRRRRGRGCGHRRRRGFGVWRRILRRDCCCCWCCCWYYHKWCHWAIIMMMIPWSVGIAFWKWRDCLCSAVMLGVFVVVVVVVVAVCDYGDSSRCWDGMISDGGCTTEPPAEMEM